MVDLFRALRERGHEVFVALRPTNEWQGRLDFLPSENFLHVSVRNSFGMFSAKQIARFIDNNAIDILHAHVARDYIAASIAARSAKQVKFVLTRHVVFPMKSFQRFALRNVDAAIGVSPVVGTQLEKTFSRDKVHVIHNGISFNTQTDSVQQAAEFKEFHRIPAAAPLVVTLGELKILKGQRDFVLAANEVVKRIPHCRFVVAGRDNSVDRHFRRELKRLVRILGIEENFLWLDWLDDIQPFLAATDIFVSPSHSESFGLAILDAMASGTAVVATATDGARELIAEKHALVPISDPLALADKICELLENEEKRSELGRRLQSTAHERFSLDRMVDTTEALYRRLTKLP